MSVMAMTVNEMLDTLDQDDYMAVIKYIEFLSAMKKSTKADTSKKALKEIQDLFGDDKGWESEEAMLSDMADFRRGRLKR